MTSCILWQNKERNIALIDIPQSLKDAQGADFRDSSRQLISSRALEQPYPSTEPKSTKAIGALPETKIEDLILQKHLQLVLDLVYSVPGITWSLPRNVIAADEELPLPGAKRRLSQSSDVNFSSKLFDLAELDLTLYSTEVFHNPKATTEATRNAFSSGTTFVPPLSSFILGDIMSTCDTFAAAAPKFDCVIMDPPWPNRSAKRRKAYGISGDTSEIRRLLSKIPLRDHLNDNALVGVWITNKPIFREMLLDYGGLFDEWNVELEEEWTWMKVTTFGEPICALNSTWRKPYEVLLIGRRRCPDMGEESVVTRRVIVGIPDLHSRKPNLKALLEPMLPQRYAGLEIFARNLTAGWWAWGNEVPKFQHERHWRDPT